MTCRRIFLASLLILFISIPALAGLKDIKVEKLPQDKSVITAYNDMLAIEPYVERWGPEWHHEIAKEKVVAVARRSLEELQKACESFPENEELLLLTGEVAHYAHNVDVEGTGALADSALRRAIALEPSDVRPEWFLGNHLVQTGRSREGAENLLAIESQHSWKELPATFWDDYIEACIITNMPAHALRAGNYLARMHAEPSRLRDTYLDIARKRFTVPDAAGSQEVRSVWYAHETGSECGVEFVASAFGVSLCAKAEWRVQPSGGKNGQTTFVFELGPYKCPAGDVTPEILLIVRQAKPGESLEDFLRASAPNKPGSQLTTRASALLCPAQLCLSAEIVRPGGYQEAGDAHAFVTVFQREAPDFPSLLFEHPSQLPQGEEGKISYFHPNEFLHRFEGRLYYMVLLDTASSVREPAQKDYEFFLQHMRAE